LTILGLFERAFKMVISLFHIFSTFKGSSPGTNFSKKREKERDGVVFFSILESNFEFYFNSFVIDL